MIKWGLKYISVFWQNHLSIPWNWTYSGQNKEKTFPKQMAKLTKMKNINENILPD